MTEMNGEPWNTPPRQEEKPQIQNGVCIALKRQTKCGGQKGCMACCRHAGANPRDLGTRSQDTVNNEVAQTDRASSNDSREKTPHNLSKDTMQSTNGGTAMAAGRPAPEDSHVVVAAVADLTVRKGCRRQHQLQRPGSFCMAATKVNVKEQHHSSRVGWRNMTAWYGKHETNKCWGKIKNILMGEMVVGVPTTFVSENHGNVVVHRGIDFPSSGSVATSNVIERVRTAHFNTKIMPRIRPMQFGGGMTGKRNSCRGMR